MESKPFFFGYHNLYSVKSKVIITLVGLAMHSLNAAKRAASDKQNMLDSLRKHRDLIKKTFDALFFLIVDLLKNNI